MLNCWVVMNVACWDVFVKENVSVNWTVKGNVHVN